MHCGPSKMSPSPSPSPRLASARSHLSPVSMEPEPKRARRATLHEACFDGDLETVRELLRDGVDKDDARASDGATPLRMACWKGHTEVVRLLVNEGGADVNKATTDEHGITPLHMAREKGSG